MNLRERIYSGWAELLGGSSQMSANRRRAVWYICVVSTAMYVVACASIVHWWVETRLSVQLPSMDFIAATIGVTILLLSDLRFEYRFFGAREVPLADGEVGKSTILAFFFTLFAFVAFMGFAILLFSPGK